MDNQNQRNLILAVVLTALILFGWDAGMRYLYPNANKAQPAASASAPAPQPSASGKPTREGGLMNEADRALEARDLASALNPAARIAIDAPGLTGSINLVGGVVDDLSTRRHTAAIDKASGLPLRATSDEDFEKGRGIRWMNLGADGRFLREADGRLFARPHLALVRGAGERRPGL